MKNPDAHCGERPGHQFWRDIQNGNRRAAVRR
ncbi:unannotated protein [freshwater metagenome]|uniref:Unannotated protein n=1 Tax=freshwater metagenome TaxID=449393 RepID=A0A6J7SJK4_9ZZZZ